ncbi:unnamed protein product [Ilex paraguariensis]|uniref:Non-haem dioxygenase N-terminal domain-containing protein n=1 Tax=Ilex paraguariensis TaxID=185542 RepID=A0ABC8SJL1_9AQUA
METKLISSAFRSASLPESYVRPESERPNLSQVDDWENVPLVDLGCGDKNLLLQQIVHARREYGVFQMEVAARMLVVDPEFFGLPVEEMLKYYSDDPSKTMRLHTNFNVKKETIHNWEDYLRLRCLKEIMKNMVEESVAADGHKHKDIWGKKLKGPALNFDAGASSSSNCGSGTNQTPSDDMIRIIIDEPSALDLFDQMLKKIKKDEHMKLLSEGAIDCLAKLNDVVIGTASTVTIGLVGFANTGSSFSPTLSFLGVANATAFVCAFTAITLRLKKPMASRIMTKIGGIASSSSIVGAVGIYLPDNIAWASWVAAIIPAVAVALF